MALCLTLKIWGDPTEDILDSWQTVERSFSGIKYVGLQVMDKQEDEQIVNAIEQAVLDTFTKHNQPLASKEEYDLQDSQLGIFISREQGIDTVTILFHILIDEEPELFYVDCFSSEEEGILQKITSKVGEIISDMLQGNSSFKIFIEE